ncbi:MAG: GNAT family N-acetyltransferase [Bacteroidales bacterium]|nr:GNAT family N-acetyltransferase [Bacteroidales bacterium]
MYVHPDHQRKGIGRRLAVRLIELAVEKRLNRIWLDATPLAKPLYDKLGFRLISPMTDWVEGVALHYFKMEKIL